MAATNTLDNQNRADVLEANSRPYVPRSVFDLSNVNIFTGEMGALIPCDLLEVVPGDSVDLSNQVLVTISNPLVQRMLSGAKIVTHTYYMKNEHLWQGWKNYITKGRSGSINLNLPKLNTRVYHLANGYAKHFDPETATDILPDSSATPFVPQGLPSYLGVPPLVKFSNNTSGDAIIPENSVVWFPFGYSTQQYATSHGSTVTTLRGLPSSSSGYFNYPIDINALPFAMYQRIYRDFYLNQNLVQNNHSWFPDNEDDWIIPYSAIEVTCMPNVDGEINEGSKRIMGSIVPINYDYYNASVGDVSKQFPDSAMLACLRYRQWNGDRFTTALPWLQRGDVQELPIDFSGVDLSNLGLNFSDSEFFRAGTPATYPYAQVADSHKFWISDTATDIPFRFGDSSPYISNANNMFRLQLNKGTVTGSLLGSFGVTANQIRELFALSLWKERNGRTDGDYNSLIRAHFNRNPHSVDRSPVYIGGTTQRLVFSEVLQTSEDGSTPLGTQAGRAVSAAEGRIGHFDVPDYGYIMTLISVVPDVYYTEGLPHELDGSLMMEDQYFPEFNNMAPQPVLNKEIYVKPNSTAENNDVFAYQERYAYMKYRANQLHGYVALSPDDDSYFASYTFARHFTQVPQFNENFVTMSPYTLRRDMFSVPSQPSFIFTVANRVRAVRPLPYVAVPGGLTNA